MTGRDDFFFWAKAALFIAPLMVANPTRNFAKATAGLSHFIRPLTLSCFILLALFLNR